MANNSSGYGVVVKVDIDTSGLSGRISEAVQKATTGKNKIVISGFHVDRDGLRAKIQTAVDGISKNIPISLSSFNIPKAAAYAAMSKINKYFKEHPASIDLNSSDVLKQIQNIGTMISKMLGSSDAKGLFDFLNDADTGGLEKVADAEKRIEETTQKVRNAAVDAAVALKNLTAISSSLRSSKISILSLTDSDAIAKANEEYDKIIFKVEELRQAIRSGARTADESTLAEINGYEQEAIALRALIDLSKKKETQQRQQANAAIKNQADISAVQEMKDLIAEFQSTHGNVYGAFASDFERYLSKLNSEAGVTVEELKEIKSEVVAIQQIAGAGGISSHTLFDSMKSAWDVVSKFGLVTNFYAQISNTIKSMVNNVIELDTAMTELKKVTDLSTEAYSSFQKQAGSIARNVGASISDTINATADFARLGYDLQDAAELAEAALVYKNVGDGITDISMATESLISTIKAFGIEAKDSMYIVDMFNEVGNNFAISSVGIGDALQRSAAALAAAGNTIQESIGLVTAMNSVVQNPDSVGTAMKTLTMYLRASKTEAEAAGIETDGMAESVSKLRSELKSLTGVDIMLDDKNFKSTYQIMQEIADVWEHISDVSQANVLNLLGGKRNGNVISSLLTNFGTAEQAVSDALDALGSASRENEAYLDSIEGHLTQLSVAFQELSTNAISSDIIKFFIDFGTTLINVANWLQKVGLLLPTIVSGFIALRGVKIASDVTKILSQANQLFANGKTAKETAAALSGAMSGLSNTGRVLLKTLLSVDNGSVLINNDLRNQMSTTAGLALGNKALANSMDKVTVAGKGVRSAFSGIGAAVSIITFAISAVITLSNHLEEVTQHKIDKANEIIETYNQAEKTYKSNIESLDSLKSRFYQLSDAIDKTGVETDLSASEYDEWRSIVQQIVDISPQVVIGYNSQGEAIIDYKNGIAQAREELEKLHEIQRQEYIGKGDELFTGKAIEYHKAQVSMGKAGKELETILSPDIIQELDDELAGRTNKKIAAINKAVTDIGQKWVRGSWDYDYEVLTAIYDKQDAFMNSLEASRAYTEAELRSIETVIGKMASSRKQLMDIESDQLDYIQTRLRSDADKGNASWYNSIPLTAMDEFKSGVIGIIDPLKSMQDNLEAVIDWGKIFASTFSNATAALDESGNTITYDYIQNLIKNFNAAADDAEDQIDKIKNAIDTFLNVIGGDAKYAAVYDVISAYLYSIIPGIGDIPQEIQPATEAIGKLSDSVKAFSNTLQIAQQAKSEMLVGGLSVDTINDIISALDDGERLSDYVNVENGALKLNIEAWEARSNAIGLSKDISSLSGNIDILSTQNNDIVSANEELHNYNEELDRLIASTEQDIDTYKNTPGMGSYVEAWKGQVARWKDIRGENAKTMDANYKQFVQNAELIKQYTADLQVYQAMLQAMQSDAVIDFSDNLDALDKIKSQAKSVNDLYEKLKAGTALSQDDKDSMFAMFKDPAILSAETIEQQTALVNDYFSVVQKAWDDAIESQKAYYTTMLAESNLDEIEPESISAINAYLAALDTMSGYDLSKIYAAAEAERAAKSVKDIVSSLNSAKSLIGNVFAELADTGYNSLDSLTSFIDLYGDGWESAVAFDTNGFKISTDAIYDRVDALIDENIADQRLAEQMKSSIRIDTEKERSAKRLEKAISGVSNVTQRVVGTVSSDAISYSDYQELISINARYSEAVVYQNGVLTLNKQKYDEVTQSVLQEAKAQAEANKAAILADKTYQDLVSRKDSLDDYERKELNRLNAEITGYDVLTKEIDNASSALQRFLNTSDNTDTASYSAGQKAWEVINDTMNNAESDRYGKFGREQFSEAINFLIRPQVQFDTPEFNAEMERLQRYFTEDNSGIRAFYDDIMKQPGFVVNGMLNATIADMAEAFQISENAVRALIEQYNTTQYEEKNKIKVIEADNDDAKKQGQKTGEAYNDGVEETIPEAKSVGEKVADSIGMGITEKDVSPYVQAFADNLIDALDSAVESSDLQSKGQEIVDKILGGSTNPSDYVPDGYNGNVDLTNRKIIPEKFLIQADYKIIDENGNPIPEDEATGYATIFGHTFLAGDMSSSDMFEMEYSQPVVLNATPILADGTVLDKANFEGYLQDLLTESMQTGRSVMELDAEQYGLLLSFDNVDGDLGDAIDQAVEYANTLHELQEEWDNVRFENNWFGDTTVDAYGVFDALEDVNESAKNLSSTKIDIDTSPAVASANAVSSALSGIITLIDRINRMRISVTGSGVPGIGGTAAANGSRFTPGGRTLVGELGMETVVDPETNRWYTVGDHGAEFRNLPRGAIVFDAEQTKKLFSSGKLQSRGTAMASGNAHAKSSLLQNRVYGGVSSSDAKAIEEAAKAGAEAGVKAGSDITIAEMDKDGPKVDPPKKGNGGGKSAAESATSLSDTLDDISERYDDLDKQLEHLIEHQKILYDEAERAMNYDGMAASLTRQIEIYKDKMAKFQQGVDEMIAAGADDSSEELEKLEESMWDAERSMFDVIDQLNSLRVDALNDKIDKLQDTWSKLSTAADEFNASGGLTVDTFQDLLENGLQYLSLLENVDGQYVINEEGIKRMIAAEKEQMAIEQALSYLAQVREALTNNSSNALKNLANLTEVVSNNTWGIVDAQLQSLKALGLSGELYANVSENVERLKALSDAVIVDSEKKSSDSIDYILKKTEELVKYEVKQQQDALKDQLQAYKDILDAKKESLKVSKETDDYEENIAEKTKEIATLQTQIDQLSLDNSREARARRAQLEKDLADKQKELKDTQDDHAYDAQVDALDKAAEDFEKTTNDQIEALDKTISSEEKVYQLAIQRINDSWNTLYQDLIDWNTEAGSVLNAEITSNWNNALAAAEKYGSYVAALTQQGIGVVGSGQKNLVVADVPKYHTGGVVGNKGSLNSKEVIAVLNKGEGVLNENGMHGLWKIVDFASALSERLGTAIGKMSFGNLNTMDYALAGIGGGSAAAVTGNGGFVFNPTFEVSVNGNMSPAEARNVGETIANSAIDRLYEAFERRGITRGGRGLKQ